MLIQKIENNLIELNSFSYRRNGQDVFFDKKNGKVFLRNDQLNYVYIDTEDNLPKISIIEYPENAMKIGRFYVSKGNILEYVLEDSSTVASDDNGKMWFNYSFYPAEAEQAETYLYFNNFSSEEHGAPIVRKSLLKKIAISVKTPIEVDLILRKCSDLLTDVLTFSLSDNKRFFIFEEINEEFEAEDEICLWVGVGTGEVSSDSINVNLFFVEV